MRFKFPCFSIVPDLRSPDTINKELEPKEKQLAAALNIEPINCAQVIVTHKTPDIAPEFHYPFDYVYPTVATACHTTPLKRMHFISDDLDEAHTISVNAENLSDDMKTVQESATLMQSTKLPNATELPEVARIPNYMQIPNLWNVQIETLAAPSRASNTDAESAAEPGDSGGSSSTSDWELVDNQ